MNWIQIRVELSGETVEAIEESLLAAGAVAVTMQDGADQPLLEPELGTTPIWDDTIVTGLYESDADIDEVTRIARAVFQGLSDQPFPELKVDILENEDWTRKWIENFKPIAFGSRLWICPSWTPAPNPEAVNLMLDPGLAFGTGTHPTTALCLKWLDSADLQNKVVIDYGCGSGILGIAALLLGAKKVIAVDTDPQALAATLDNAQRNNVASGSIECFLPEDCPQLEADLVLANILAKPLYELKDRLASLCKAGGNIVLSGLLREQAEGLSSHYSSPFKMEPASFEGDWSRLSGQK
jgi:ribosomal protein L11 methyltransferase